jgi:hypothetical protein
MTTLRSYIDPDQQAVTEGPTVFKTERSEYEIHCGMCGRVAYVDKETFRQFSEATQAGLDNPYRCEPCEEEYDDLSYEG